MQNSSAKARTPLLEDLTKNKSMRGNALSQTGSRTLMASLALNSLHSDSTGSSCALKPAAEPVQISFTVRAIKSLRAVQLKGGSVFDYFLHVSCENKRLAEGKSPYR